MKASVLATLALAIAAAGCSGGNPPSEPLANDPIPSGPLAVAVSASGEIYASAHNIVYAFDAEGKLRIFAGSGRDGYSGDGGPATLALLNFPAFHDAVHPIDGGSGVPIPFADGPVVAGLAVDAAGRLLIADGRNGRVRRVDRDGTISTVRLARDDTTIPLGVARGVAIGADGSLYVSGATGLHGFMPDGSVLGLDNAKGPIAVEPLGSVLIATECRIDRVFNDGEGGTVAGGTSCGYSGDGPSPFSSLSSPQAVATDAQGNIFIADTFNNCVRKLDRAGVLSRFAGTCGPGLGGFGGDGGPSTSARLARPYGVATGGDGAVYIADTHNSRVRKVDVNGFITTLGILTKPTP